MITINGRDVSFFYSDDIGYGSVMIDNDTIFKGNITIKINNTKISIDRKELEKAIGTLNE
jgi:hypothetical protein